MASSGFTPPSPLSQDEKRCSSRSIRISVDLQGSKKTGGLNLGALHFPFEHGHQIARLTIRRLDVHHIRLSIVRDLETLLFMRRRMNIELNFPPDFEGLVLGCIDADFCKYIVNTRSKYSRERSRRDLQDLHLCALLHLLNPIWKP